MFSIHWYLLLSKQSPRLLLPNIQVKMITPSISAIILQSLEKKKLGDLVYSENLIIPTSPLLLDGKIYSSAKLF